MPLPVPNLDDRSYEQLVAEVRSLIPRNFPAWTDYNPSDPGITLLQLFAYLFEAATYQLNRVPERSLQHFAELVGVRRLPGEPIQQTLGRALEVLEAGHRAVTISDFEALVRAEFPPGKQIVSIQGQLLHDYPDPADTRTTAALYTIPPTVTELERDVERGSQQLTLTRDAELSGHTIMLDDDVRTEFAHVLAVLPEGDSLVAYLWAPLFFEHGKGVEVANLWASSPISRGEMALARPARIGDPFLVLTSPVQLPPGVLRLDNKNVREYVRIHGSQSVHRVKVSVVVQEQQTVFPDEEVVLVIVVPDEPDNPEPRPLGGLREAIFDFLRSRRLITTRVRVVGPEYTSLAIDVTVVRDLRTRLARATVRENVTGAVKGFLSPLTGGGEGTGWEFGRPVFRTELYQLIERIEGVDHVRRLLLDGSDMAGVVPLASPTSLVRLDPADLRVTVVEA